ncbi:hypothetical protein [Porticoccus sp.]
MHQSLWCIREHLAPLASRKVAALATRLILSQCGHLDHLGWHNWQIRAGRLYCNDLSWRHWWEPQHLVMPLFGVKDVSILVPEQTDNVAGLISLHRLANSGSGAFLG